MFGHWSKNFRLFVQTFLAGSSKLQSTCPPDRFDVKTFPEGNMIFQFFWTLMAEFLCFLLKLFWRCCKNCTSLVQKNTLIKIESFFWKKVEKFSQTLQTLSKNCLTFCLKLFGGMSNLDSTCRWGIFLRRKVFWKIIGKLTCSNH